MRSWHIKDGWQPKMNNSHRIKKVISFKGAGAKDSTLLAMALTSFDDTWTDHESTVAIRTATTAEPEVKQVYLHFAKTMYSPRTWIEQARTLSVIQAEINIDTMFTQLNVPEPNTLMLKAALYVYMKALFHDYMRELARFER